MARIPVSNTQEGDLIPDGEVVGVRLEEITTRTVNFGSGTRLNWKFLVTEEGPYKGHTIYGDTSDSFVIHSECKAYNWAKSLSGDDYEGADVFDTDDLVGLPARVIVFHRPDRKDPARKWVNVRDVLPPKNQGTPQELQAEGAPF